MNRRLHIGRLFGVDIRVDWSFIVVFILATWTLMSLNRQLLPALDTTTRVVASLIAAAGLFASLAAHELTRVKVDRACGISISRLTMFVVGGVSDADEEKPAANTKTNATTTHRWIRSELLAAIVAPAASFAIALVIAIGVAISSAPLPRALDDLERLGAPGVVLLEVAALSFLVGLVSLLPAFPLDGGRILRVALWKVTGSVEKATRLSAWMGQFVGWSFVLVGIGLVLTASGDARALLSGAGAWTAFTGWFIASASAQGYERVILKAGDGEVSTTASSSASAEVK